MNKLLKKIPAVLVLTCVCLFNNVVYTKYSLWGDKWLLIFIGDGLTIVASWYLSKRIINYARKKYADPSQARKRSIFVLFQILALSVGYTILMYIGDLIGLWKGLFSISVLTANGNEIPILYTHSIFNVFFFSIIVFFEEWRYTKAKQRQYETQIENLKQENLRTQLDLLKSQINPHFLFNSLNTLSALVTDNPQAETFIDELSSVYRYLLQSNEETLCSLEKEIRFIKAYFHLLETRHGDGIRLNINIESAYLTYQIPPLTLQLLVENAVKHNAISVSNPLTIRITNEASKLIVENNLRLKNTPIISNKVGLANIIKKYQLLEVESINILKTDTIFRVELPLIMPS